VSLDRRRFHPLNADGTAPASPLLKRTRLTVAAGSMTPLVEDDV
jgi:alkaline phosphatase D